MTDNLLKIDQVAERLAISERSVRTLVQLGHLPKVSFLSALRFHPADVDAFIESRRSKPPAGRGKPPPSAPGADGKAA